MAGLLDYNAFNDPNTLLGLNLLAAAQSGQAFGPGLLGAIQNTQMSQRQSKKDMRDDQEYELQKRYRDAQIADLQRKSERDQRVQGLLGGLLGGSSLPGVAAPGEQSSSMGGRQGGNLANLSADQIAALKVNGVDLTDIWKEARPSYQVQNGYAYDPRTVGPGFLPGVQVSNDGRATVIRPAADRGGLEVQIPRGAAEAFGTFKGIEAGTSAAFTPERVYNPATQREEIVPRSQVLRGAQNMTGPGYAGGSSGNAANEQVRIIQSELDRLPANHPDRPAIMRELQRLGAQTPAQSGNYAAGPSAAEAAANEARRVQAVEQTKADITPTAQKVSAVTTARDALGVIDQALQHPGLKTSTGLSGSMDPRNYIPGTDATNFRVLMDQIRGGVFLDAYKDLRGGGAITEVEGQKAEAAKARINRAQSPDEFVKGLQEYRSIVDRGYERARQQLPASTGGASGSWDATPQVQQAPRATMRFNPQTGRLEKVN